jgi:hypothetical protein
MVSLNLKEMTQEEKIATMEVIWADLTRTPDRVESPDWHKHALAEAQASVDNGTAQFRPLSEVKRRINEAIS